MDAMLRCKDLQTHAKENTAFAKALHGLIKCQNKVKREHDATGQEPVNPLENAAANSPHGAAATTNTPNNSFRNDTIVPDPKAGTRSHKSRSSSPQSRNTTTTRLSNNSLATDVTVNKDNSPDEANPPAINPANPPPTTEVNPPAANPANPPAANPANPPAANPANNYSALTFPLEHVKLNFHTHTTHPPDSTPFERKLAKENLKNNIKHIICKGVCYHMKSEIFMVEITARKAFESQRLTTRCRPVETTVEEEAAMPKSKRHQAK
ncbi:hypothetical protein C0991_009878 [Blastosporella zonata]|nr:hypothetical protein C0991_009878 [Blastosporella zonata]